MRERDTLKLPDYQTIMLPMLQVIADGKEHQINQYVADLADRFGLTDDDLRQMLPSGNVPVFRSRVSWAVTYLVHAGLIDRTGRGRICITERGRHTVKENPGRIDDQYLRQFPEFVAFEARSRAKISGKAISPEITLVRPNGQPTPSESLEANYLELRRALAQEILEKLTKTAPSFFEQLVIDVLFAMGYGGSRREAARTVGRSGDGGIDGIINEDRLGLDIVYVQAKRWNGAVGRPMIQTFAGSLEGQRARKGVFITTSTFTAEARDYVNRIEKRIVLIDGEQLAELMIDHGVGVIDVARYEVKRIDEGYFGEG